MKIGIPRALLYYWYGHYWESFWRSCDCTVIISPPTDREIMTAGSVVALEEICLPVKIFLGHCLNLAPQVDWIMLPHLVKVEEKAYICPKFMGLPDVVAHTLPEISAKMLTVKVGPKHFDQERCLKESASRIGKRPTFRVENKMEHMYMSPAHKELQSCIPSTSKAGSSPLTIGVLGHPYCVYDSYFNLDLLGILQRRGARVVTAEMMPPEWKGRGVSQLSKELFWTVGRFQMDAMDWMLHGEEHTVDGLIQVSAFACGPEAIVGDLIERRIKHAGKPLLKLNYEEHSGEAGLLTRLEAFLDLLHFRRKR